MSVPMSVPVSEVALSSVVTSTSTARPSTSGSMSYPESVTESVPDFGQFIGLSRLLDEHARQIAEFRDWAAARKWEKFAPKVIHR